MSESLPKIWNTPFMLDPENGRNIDFHIDRKQIDYVREYQRFDSVSRDQAPSYLFFSLSDLKTPYKEKLPDLMVITGGLLIVSEKMPDILVQFDLGATQLFEVPLYEYDQKTQRPGKWYILHIAATKNTVIPEKSENVFEKPIKGYWGPSAYDYDVLAVHANSAVGEDLWGDPHFKSRLFLTDRLKVALTTADLRIIKVPMRPCVVIG